MEKVVDKVLQRNPNPIRQYIHGERKVMVHCLLVGLVCSFFFALLFSFLDLEVDLCCDVYKLDMIIIGFKCV